MARFVVQSQHTWQFLHAHPVRGDVQWTPSLAAAVRFGVLSDESEVADLIADHCDRGEALVVDLDADR